MRSPTNRPTRAVGAPVEDLAKLHRALAEALAERLRSGKARASDMMVIRAFLKDNGIKAKGAADQLAGLESLAAVKLPEFTN